MVTLNGFIQEINDDINVKQWIEGKKYNTKISYLNALADFCIVNNTTPSEIIETLKKETEGSILPKESSIGKWFKNYRKYSNKKGLSYNTVNNRLNIIKNFIGFYNLNRFIEKKKNNKKIKASSPKEFLTKKDIKKLLNAKISRKIRAIILVQASSGLSAQDISKLRVKDFRNGIIEQYDRVNKKYWNICKLNFERSKDGESYFTFLSEEAVEAVQDYLLFERDIQGDNDALFSDAKDSGKPFTVAGIQEAYRRLNDSLGFKPENKGEYRKFTPKSMREFFKNQMISSGANEMHRKFVMGYKIDEIIDEDEILEMYDKYMHKVTMRPIKPPISMDTYNELMDLMHEYADMVENEEFDHDKELLEENKNLREALYGVMGDNRLFKTQFKEMNKKIEELQREIKKSK